MTLAKFVYCKVALTAPTSSARSTRLCSWLRSVTTPMGLAPTPSDPLLSFLFLQVSPRMSRHRLHAASAHALSPRGLTVTPRAELQRFSTFGPVLCPQTTHLLELSCLLLQSPKRLPNETYRFTPVLLPPSLFWPPGVPIGLFPIGAPTVV
jgi:hypothetical protein